MFLPNVYKDLYINGILSYIWDYVFLQIFENKKKINYFDYDFISSKHL